MQIAFVFTNFNNSKYSVEAVRSIISSSYDEVVIVIVDNNSREGEKKILAELEFCTDNLKVIYNSENIGYFHGLNVGIDYVRKSYPQIIHIVVGNNDLVFSGDFFANLSRRLSLFDRYPVVSPDIVTIDGFHQNPHVLLRISRFRELIYDLYHLNYYLAVFIKKVAVLTSSFSDRTDEKHYLVSQEITQGYGACYILGPLFFEKFKRLQSPTFIMHEEYFLAEQLAEKGYRIYYESSISVRHHWHATMDTIPSKQKWEYARQAHRLARAYKKRKFSGQSSSDL